jgi:hypothetical protein
MSLRKVISSNGKNKDTGAVVSPPSWLPDNLCYETIMGSEAYGVSSGASESVCRRRTWCSRISLARFRASVVS